MPGKSLKESIRLDILIVGGGVSGAFMADALAGRYPRVALVDHRFRRMAARWQSAALLQFEIDTPLIEN